MENTTTEQTDYVEDEVHVLLASLDTSKATKFEKKEFPHPTKKNKTVWMYRPEGTTEEYRKQSDVFDLVISRDTIEVLQLDTDVFNVEENVSAIGRKRVTYALRWRKEDVVDTDIVDICKQIKGIVTLTEFGMDMLELRRKIENKLANNQVKFSPKRLKKIGRAHV